MGSSGPAFSSSSPALSRTTCLVFGNPLNRTRKRFQQVFPRDLSTGTGLPQQYHRDPFLVLSTIAAEYVSIMGDVGMRLAASSEEHQDKTGVFATFYNDSLRDSPSALPSQTKRIHVCNRRLAYFMYVLECQISLLTFLQRQHRVFNEFQTKVVIDGVDGNEFRWMKDESMASQKVSFSLDLSASFLHSLLSDIRAISRDTEISVSIVQSMTSQFASRTNVSIARDSKRIAFDAKKDSVAMKTIAGLTMVFLPGTFTATFFSMVFFHVTDDPEPRLTVNKHWWLYVAVTVPLTVLVLAAWLGWLRWKRRGMPENAELEDLGEK